MNIPSTDGINGVAFLGVLAGAVSYQDIASHFLSSSLTLCQHFVIAPGLDLALARGSQRLNHHPLVKCLCNLVAYALAEAVSTGHSNLIVEGQLLWRAWPTRPLRRYDKLGLSILRSPLQLLWGFSNDPCRFEQTRPRFSLL